MADAMDYPFHVNGQGRTATTRDDDHVRDLIHQVLFTNPGERVNRPDFGCGLKQMVFGPNSDAIAAATQMLVQGSLQRWLEGVIDVERVAVDSQESTLLVTVVYHRLGTGERRREVFAP